MLAVPGGIMDHGPGPCSWDGVPPLPVPPLCVVPIRGEPHEGPTHSGGAVGGTLVQPLRTLEQTLVETAARHMPTHLLHLQGGSP